MTQLKLDLGAETFVKMVVDEAKGNLESPEYEARTMQLLARHLRRSTPFEIERSLERVRRDHDAAVSGARPGLLPHVGARTSFSSPARSPTGTSPIVSARSTLPR